MTIGALSRRTGVPVKTLRQYEDLGLIYTVGRSAGNYRLFDDEAPWCVGVVRTLRGLGLTLAEIRDEGLVFLAILGAGLVFEGAWYLARRTNALSRDPTTA